MIPDTLEIRTIQSVPEKAFRMGHMRKVNIDGCKDGSVVDRKAALERAMGDEQFLSELLLEFTDWLVGIRKKINTAIAHNNFKSLAKEANLLSGAAGNIGAEGLSDAAFGLETASRKGVIQEILQSHRKLEQEAKSFLEYTRAD